MAYLRHGGDSPETGLGAPDGRDPAGPRREGAAVPLEGLGLTAEESAAYRLLVARPSGSVEDVASVSDGDADEAREHLLTLQREKVERKKKWIADRKAKGAQAGASEAIQEKPSSQEPRDE